MTYKCKCDKCGNEFDSDEIVTIKYREYPGATSMAEDFVSPCCHNYFDDIDEVNENEL